MNYNQLIDDNIESLIEKELNIPMWSSLTHEEKNNIISNGSDTAPANYHKCLILKNDPPQPSLMNIISYDPYCGLLSRGIEAKYTLNLKTKTPTKNSNIQTKLSENLCNEIIKSKSYLQESIISSNTHITENNSIKPRDAHDNEINIKTKEGNFSNSYGKIITNYDSTWEGNWKKGKLYGIGRYENKDIIYEGNYTNSKFKGFGILTYKKENKILICKWKKNFENIVKYPVFLKENGHIYTVTGNIKEGGGANKEELFSDGHMETEHWLMVEGKGLVKDTNWNKPNIERAKKYKTIEEIFNKYFKLSSIKPIEWSKFCDILLEIETNYNIYYEIFN